MYIGAGYLSAIPLHPHPQWPLACPVHPLITFSSKAKGSRSNSPCGTELERLVTLSALSPEGPGDTHLVAYLGSVTDSPHTHPKVPSTQWEGTEQCPKQNRLWVTEVSQPGTLWSRAPQNGSCSGWPLAARIPGCPRLLENP